jgi:hypothetical protein
MIFSRPKDMKSIKNIRRSMIIGGLITTQEGHLQDMTIIVEGNLRATSMIDEGHHQAMTMTMIGEGHLRDTTTMIDVGLLLAMTQEVHHQATIQEGLHQVTTMIGVVHQNGTCHLLTIVMTHTGGNITSHL